MPTTETIIVDTDTGSGAPYNTLAEAISGESGRNLVSEDKILRFLCRASAGDPDTGSVVAITSSTFTVDSTRYVILEGDGANPGYWDTSRYHFVKSWSSTTFNIQLNYTRVIGLQINNTHNSGNCMNLAATTGGAPLYVEDCIFTTTSSSKNGTGLYLSGTYIALYAKNCLAYNFSGGSGIGFEITSGSYVKRVYNCTAAKCYTGFSNTDDTGGHFRDCLARGCTDGFYTSSGWGSETDYNISDVASDAPGTNSFQATPTMVDYANNDFRLDSSDTYAKDAGEDLSSDSTFPIDDDVAGTSRPQGSTSDIGFFEVVATASKTAIATASQVDITYTLKDAIATASQVDIVHSLKTAVATASQLETVYDERGAVATATQLELVHDLKTAVATASQLELVHDLKTAVATASQIETIFDERGAVATATQLELVFDLKQAVATATQLELVFTLKTSVVTASQLELVFDLKDATATATQLEIVYTEIGTKSTIVTAVQLELVYDLKDATATATQLETVYTLKDAVATATQLELVFTERGAVATAAQLEAVYDERGAVATATQLDIVFTTVKSTQVTAVQVELVFTLKDATASAVQLELVHDLKTAQATAVQLGTVFDERGAVATAAQLELVFDERGAVATASQLEIVYDLTVALQGMVTAVQVEIVYDPTGNAWGRILKRGRLDFHEVKRTRPRTLR